MAAAIVSGLRLKPYMDAGEKYTPPSFALYLVLIAAAIAFAKERGLALWDRHHLFALAAG